MMAERVSILIIGGGSAGFAAAYGALRAGASGKLALVERNPGLGGTSVYGGVNCWEPGVSGNGVHREIARRLLASGGGFVGETVEFVSREHFWAVSDRSRDPYECTLVRHGVPPEKQRRFHFEPDAMSRAMLSLLREADADGRLELLFGSSLRSVETASGRVTVCAVETPSGTRTFAPDVVIDCSADIIAAEMSGCRADTGEDPRRKYGEPSAPETAGGSLNGITQAFRVTPCADDFEETVPPELADADISGWETYMERVNGPVSCFNVYPNGDINVNMLPTIEGEALLRFNEPELRKICAARVYAYWRRVRTATDFKGYRIKSLFPMLGIRESRRLLGRRVLTEADLRAGAGDPRAVAFADHPADTHGGGNAGLRPTGLYGIPYECLLPREIDNMLVACRGASFSHIAASSARLSRTMLALGEAAGIAAADCASRGVSPADADVTRVRAMMGI